MGKIITSCIVFSWGSPKYAEPAETNFELSSCEFATSKKNFKTFIFPIESKICKSILWQEDSYSPTYPRFGLEKAHVLRPVLNFIKK